MDKDQILKKWLSDDLTTSELEQFEQNDDFNLNNEIVEGAKYFKASHFSSVSSYDEFKANLKEKKGGRVMQLSSYKMLYRIAALFVIGFSTYFFLFYNNLTEVQTLASNKITFELPDASSVTLNAGSKVEYSKKKWANKRELTLEGEAFFKVAKGSKFDVKTSDGIVSVLGTQFTVKQRPNYFEVKCFEGIVSVDSNGKTHKLTKGNTYRIIDDVTTIDITSRNQPNWIDNVSSFNSVPLYEVLEELERQYNVDISVEQFDAKRLFTGGFVHNNLEEALTSVTVPFNLTHRKDNSNKIILYKME